MSNGINDYLRNLLDNSKLNKLFADDHTDVTVCLDLYTGEYKGARIRFEHDNKTVDLSTEDLRIVCYGEKKSTTKLDSLTALGIDYEVVSKFNVYKLDEDYYADLKENLADDIKDLYEKESDRIYEALIEYLRDIKDNDYDEEIIQFGLKNYDIAEKKDHYIVTRNHKATSIKYNTSKNKFTIKNVSSYKNKFDPEDVVKGFETYKFNEAIRNIIRKKIYNKKRIDLDDGMSDTFSPLGGVSTYVDGDFS